MVTDGEQSRVERTEVVRRKTTTEEATALLQGYAKEHVRPTIESLSLLEETVRACRETLEKELAQLTERSQAFAERNEAAQHCLRVCTEAVERLMDGRLGA